MPLRQTVLLGRKEKCIIPDEGRHRHRSFERSNGAFGFDQVIVSFFIELQYSWIVCELDVEVRCVCDVFLALLQNGNEALRVCANPVVLLEHEAGVFRDDVSGQFGASLLRVR